jgi:hypothetical protein
VNLVPEGLCHVKPGPVAPGPVATKMKVWVLTLTPGLPSRPSIPGGPEGPVGPVAPLGPSGVENAECPMHLLFGRT